MAEVTDHGMVQDYLFSIPTYSNTIPTGDSVTQPSGQYRNLNYSPALPRSFGGGMSTLNTGTGRVLARQNATKKFQLL
ncbi:uncharacterized protein LAJ45_03621 [Morchella importuna]|uniref:uncharacterized protein n=1 Tax=Morchella importuna TaxID=1174673 RepID=UPI001E8E1C25|nr:uncharacterized protein LAJ45_03621 [Morchella importuna]KAH8152195.1 hypothetical protein LAJ45_03621 [Morchella importuna]